MIMSKYQATCAHSANDVPGTLNLSATNDAEAIAEVLRLVKDGHRDRTWATVELSTGKIYRCANKGGNAVARLD
jgi:hypothetical protein